MKQNFFCKIDKFFILSPPVVSFSGVTSVVTEKRAHLKSKFQQQKKGE
jgi:hypothetical protein